MCGDDELRLFLFCDVERPHQPGFHALLFQAFCGLQCHLHWNIHTENGHFDANPMADEMGRGDLQPFGVVRFGRGEFLDG